MKNDNILVIGGSGFIGEYLVKELEAAKKKVLIFDRKSPRDIEYYISQVSVVVFLARPDKDLLKRTLKAVSVKKINTFLYTSSLLVYKGGEKAQKETDPFLPVTQHAKEKLKEEKIILNLKKNHPGINIIISRLGNVYGGPKNKGFIGLIFKQISEGKSNNEIIIAGDGLQLRDYVFVDDVAKTLSLILLNNTKIGVVNISTGVGTTLLEIIGCIEKVIKKDIAYTFGPKIPESHSLIGDTTKLIKYLNWTPDTVLADGLYKTYKRYIMNDTNNPYLNEHS